MNFDLQVMLSTFVVIFLAELGDKTQVSTLAFSSKSASPLSVFIGAALALVCTTLIATVLGGVLGKVLPEKLIKIAAALVFIGFGIYTFIQVFRG